MIEQSALKSVLFCLSFHVWQLWKQRKLNNGKNYDRLYMLGLRCRCRVFFCYLWKLCVLSRIFSWLCNGSGYKIVSVWKTVHNGIQKTANSLQQNSHHMLSSLCGSLFDLTNKGIQPSTICMRQIFNNSTKHYLELYLCTFDSFQFLNSKKMILLECFSPAFWHFPLTEPYVFQDSNSVRGLRGKHSHTHFNL